MLISMKRLFLLCILSCLWVGPREIQAQQVVYPALTGRVVDRAGLISLEQRQSLIKLLENYERQSSNQVVVAIVQNLQGQDIATYANMLFRLWKLGAQDKNNGVLLLVAVNEKELAIEVGYGLEGNLTDLISNQIIQNQIIPYFKESRWFDGINNGVQGIIASLDGTYKASDNTKITGTEGYFIPVAFIVLVVFLFVLKYRKNKFSKQNLLQNNTSNNNYHQVAKNSGRQNGSGNFSGKGGSSGGGGARGKW